MALGPATFILRPLSVGSQVATAVLNRVKSSEAAGEVEDDADEASCRSHCPVARYQRNPIKGLAWVGRWVDYCTESISYM